MRWQQANPIYKASHVLRQNARAIAVAAIVLLAVQVHLLINGAAEMPVFVVPIDYFDHHIGWLEANEPRVGGGINRLADGNLTFGGAISPKAPFRPGPLDLFFPACQRARQGVVVLGN